MLNTNERPSNKIRRVFWASFLGTSLEWYDFFIYGTVAALAFNKLFFPSYEPSIGILLSFGTFAAGFVARPLGALIFGHFGDTIGRKRILVITMLLMGLSTIAIGLLPTYDQVGVLSAYLLLSLRILQGVALGGEWGGAVLMVAEHGDGTRRGLQTSWSQIGVPVGNLLSVGTLALISSFLSDQQFQAWGWRLPFLFSAALVAVGFWVRSRVDESPEYSRIVKNEQQEKQPLLALFKSHKRELLISCGTRIGADVSFYVFSLFVLTYLTSSLGMAKSDALRAVSLGTAIQIFVIPFFAHMSDSWGRQKVLLLGTVGSAAWAYPFFNLIDSGSVGNVNIAICVGMTFWGILYAPLAAFIPELFPTRVRYSGTSVGFQLSGILGGGIAPLVASGLLRQYQTSAAIAAYVCAALMLTLIAVVSSVSASSSRTRLLRRE